MSISIGDVKVKQCSFTDIAGFQKEAERAGLCFNKSTEYYMAYRDDGEILSVAGVMFFSKKARFKNDYTVPKYRGLGLWSMLFDYRVKQVKARGIRLIEATCTDMSYEKYLRKGGIPVKNYKKYVTVEIRL